jgi:hypothetical protein
MFTYDDLRGLLAAVPFVPFRLHLSEGNFIEVRHREMVFPGRRYAVIGLVDPTAPDAPYDRHAVVFYLHVNRVETLYPGPAPGGPHGGPTGTPAPARP